MAMTFFPAVDKGKPAEEFSCVYTQLRFNQFQLGLFALKSIFSFQKVHFRPFLPFEGENHKKVVNYFLVIARHKRGA